MKRIPIKSSISSESFKVIDKDEIYFLKRIRLDYLKKLSKFDRDKIKTKFFSLESPYLTKIKHLEYRMRTVDILTEYIEGIPLNSFMGLKKYGKYFSPEFKNYTSGCIILGLDELHKNGLLHGDMKPSNILIGKDTLSPKITDFYFNYVKITHGIPFLKKLPFTRSKYRLFGSRNYLPPCSFRNTNPVKGLDRFAMGVTLFEIFTGKPPVPSRFISSKERLPEWKLSEEHNDYYIENLEHSNIKYQAVNLILDFIVNYQDNINLKKAAKVFD